MVVFRIDIEVDTSDLSRAQAQVRQGLQKTEGAADQLRKTLARAFSLAAIGLLVKRTVQLADEFTRLQNRLRIVTNGTQNLNDVTQRLFQVSENTRSSFEGTAELYARLAVSAGELGRTENELIQFTESLNQAILLSGASAEEARAGIIQLSQGLASGALRGDELRSVLEQLPAVADVIARSLGVTRGQLRELGAQGKITADIVLNAFAEARGELAERFAKTVPTVGQAITGLQNGLLRLSGALDESIGFTRGLATALQALGDAAAEAARFFEDINRAIDNRAQEATLTQFAQLGARVESLTRELEQVSRAYEEGGRTSEVALQRAVQLQRGIRQLREEQERLRNATLDQADANLKQNETFQQVLQSLGRRERLARLSTTEASIQAELLKTLDQLEKAGARLNNTQRAEIEDKIRLIAKLKEERREREKIAGGGPSVGGVSGPQAPAALTNFFQTISSAGKTATQSLERFNREQERLLAVEDAVLRQLQQENEVLSLLANGQDELARRKQIEIDLRNAAAFATEEEIQAALRLQEANEEFRRQAEILRSIKGPAEELRKELATLNNLYETGAINAQEFGVAASRAELAALNAATSLEAGFSRAFANIRLEALDFASTIEQIFGTAVDASVDILDDLVRTGGQNFEELADQALQQIQRIILRQLVLLALSALLPGAGGAAPPIAGIFGGGRQRGGTVQPGRAFTVGERGPETFVPNQTGTVVPNAASLQQPPPQVNIMIVNEQDPEMVKKAIQSGAADDVLINRLGANKAKTRNAIG